MPLFTKGTATFRRFLALGPVPNEEKIREALDEDQFRPFQSGSEEVRSGWCDWRNPLVVPAEEDMPLMVGDWAHMGLRMRAHLNLRMQRLVKEEALGGTMASRSFSPIHDEAGPLAQLSPARQEFRPVMGETFRATGPGSPAIDMQAGPIQALRDKLSGAGRLVAATSLALGLVCAPSAKGADLDTAVKHGKAPMIQVHPKDQMVPLGGSVTMRVEASEAKAFQWHHKAKGVDQTLANGGNATLALNNVQESHEGTYYCVVTNDYGTTNSNEAQLDVVKQADPYSHDSPTFTAQRGGMEVRGFPSRVLDDMMNQMVRESTSFKEAVLTLANQGKPFVVLDGNLPANHFGDTFVTSSGNFYVVVDTVKCRKLQESPIKVLAHEIKHVLDGSKDPRKFAKDYQHEASVGSYSFNPFERQAFAFGDKVHQEVYAFRSNTQIAKATPGQN